MPPRVAVPYDPNDDPGNPPAVSASAGRPILLPVPPVPVNPPSLPEGVAPVVPPVSLSAPGSQIPGGSLTLGQTPRRARNPAGASISRRSVACHQ